ncbi:hypothetical protein [Chenggangzhangella methanolivorans]|uniref:hypothetical protein n=1 Tax=Chenggangzhangella methanolivorans TaxID=1437009 RepID=UPI003D187471
MAQFVAERAKTLTSRFRAPPAAAAGPVDVGGLVGGMGPQVRVVVEVADDLPPAKADPNQLEMALLNLGVNARDAMPDGGTLRITARQESVRTPRGDLRRGHYVRLSVADGRRDGRRDAAASSRFFQPRASAKARVWDCRWRTVSWPSSAGR